MPGSRVRIEFRRAAFKELRTCDAAIADVTGRAEAIAAAAGDGFEVLPVQAPRNRARALVATRSSDPDAIRRNAEQNTLLRSLDAGR